MTTSGTRLAAKSGQLAIKTTGTSTSLTSAQHSLRLKSTKWKLILDWPRLTTAKRDEELLTRSFEEKYGPGNQFKANVNDNDFDEEVLLARYPELSQRKAAAASASESYRRSLDQARVVESQDLNMLIFQWFYILL